MEHEKLSLGDRFFDILASGLDFVKENDPLVLFLFIAALIVFFFALTAILTDIARIIEEFIFWRWLKKDDHFILFKTEEEARHGYEEYLKQRKYASMTRGLRKKREKRLKNPGEAEKHSFAGKFLIRLREYLDYLDIPSFGEMRDNAKNFVLEKISKKKTDKKPNADNVRGA